MKHTTTKGDAMKAAPTPMRTNKGGRWRWDHFATATDAAEWWRIRKAEGYRVILRGLGVAWDQKWPRVRKRPKNTLKRERGNK
jgi:hypothetical protein